MTRRMLPMIDMRDNTHLLPLWRTPSQLTQGRQH
jgi:hypothetical protein